MKKHPDELRPEYDFSKLQPASQSKYPRHTATATVGADGQIQLPTQIREKMGLVPGTDVIVEVTPDGVLLRRAR